MINPEALQRGAVTGRGSCRPPPAAPAACFNGGAAPPRPALPSPSRPAAAQDGGAAATSARVVAGRQPSALFCPGQVSRVRSRRGWASPGWGVGVGGHRQGRGLRRGYGGGCAPGRAGATRAPACGGAAGAHRQGGRARAPALGRVRGCTHLPICVGGGCVRVHGVTHAICAHRYTYLCEYIYVVSVRTYVYIWRGMVCSGYVWRKGYTHKRVCIYRRVYVCACAPAAGGSWGLGERLVPGRFGSPLSALASGLCPAILGAC